MALRYLGPRFDIHTGGIDNVFPHHEDEIAQSAPIVGGPPARLWVHGEFLPGRRPEDGEVGRQLRARSRSWRDAASIRSRSATSCLTSRYRHKLEYTDASLAGGRGRAGLAAGAAARRSGPPPADGPWAAPAPLRAGAAGDRPTGTRRGVAGNGDGSGPAPLPTGPHAPAAPLSAAGRALHDRFVAAIDDDLDLPTALAVVREIAPGGPAGATSGAG